MRLGILGGGQLGRMLALAAAPLGVSVRVWEADARCSAARAAEIFAQPLRAELVPAFAADLTACTYEFEHIPASVVEALAAQGVPLRPPARAFAAKHDRWREKQLLEELGLPTAPCRAVADAAGLHAALADLGLPLVLKRRHGGYDGKGQAVVREAAAASAAFLELGGPAIAEAFIPFTRELSLIAARGGDGRIVSYPLVENVHDGGILRLTRAPAAASAALQAEAEAIMQRLLEALDYVGVLAIEFFEVGGRLLINEFAPRVHNSGHWTIEGAETSQFEQHVRAVLGLPLGSAAPRGHSAMLNCLGRHPEAAAVLAVPGAHLHDYGKTARARRKLAHITVRADSAAEREALLERLAPLAPWA
ncbi:MAG: 5-(carboxyamino)imidazole ribonucleotide synthase [Planctomycetota bacterium]|nr:5-(carboxyamino)imidazole ribonucleotide synthase [Planctomycetota bacterium]MCX8040192.1 5-(carboxyamino)imidazole ribonucleotide synthase [Planctomycetota bacterium]MDW8372513.1 5-(carboxyamino)imidazole ribonucleotide synthase [Planctomycetota bacterium]